MQKSSRRLGIIQIALWKKKVETTNQNKIPIVFLKLEKYVILNLQIETNLTIINKKP